MGVCMYPLRMCIWIRLLAVATTVPFKEERAHCIRSKTIIHTRLLHRYFVRCAFLLSLLHIFFLFCIHIQINCCCELSTSGTLCLICFLDCPVSISSFALSLSLSCSLP